MLKTIIIGRLVADPVKSEKVDNLVTFSVACDLSYKNKEGVKVDDVEFVNCQAWGKTGETIMKFMKKGGLQCFEGVTRTRKVESDDGVKYFTSTTVSKFEFLPNGKSESTVNTDTSSVSDADLKELPF